MLSVYRPAAIHDSRSFANRHWQGARHSEEPAKNLACSHITTHTCSHWRAPVVCRYMATPSFSLNTPAPSSPFSYTKPTYGACAFFGGIKPCTSFFAA